MRGCRCWCTARHRPKIFDMKNGRFSSTARRCRNTLSILRINFLCKTSLRLLMDSGAQTRQPGAARSKRNKNLKLPTIPHGSVALYIDQKLPQILIDTTQLARVDCEYVAAKTKLKREAFTIAVCIYDRTKRKSRRYISEIEYLWALSQG